MMKQLFAVLVAACFVQFSGTDLQAQLFGGYGGYGYGSGYGSGGGLAGSGPGYTSSVPVYNQSGGYSCRYYTDPRLGYCLENDCFCGQNGGPGCAPGYGGPGYDAPSYRPPVHHGHGCPGCRHGHGFYGQAGPIDAGRTASTAPANRTYAPGVRRPVRQEPATPPPVTRNAGYRYKF